MVSAYDTRSILKYNSKPACLLIMTKCHPMPLGSWKIMPTPSGPCLELPSGLGLPALGQLQAGALGCGIFSMIPRAGVAFYPILSWNQIR